jgi:hypothetical protein
MFMTINGAGWRIDHNLFNLCTGAYCVNVYGTTAVAPEGLFDHNTFNDGKILLNGDNTGTLGGARWAEPLNLGDPCGLCRG